jgi:hypothetical protein
LPTISEFHGIAIGMFYNDHEPEHFHAKYGEFEATFLIEALTLQTGRFPNNARRMVVEWARRHQEELRENWRRAREPHPERLARIEGLI